MHHSAVYTAQPAQVSKYRHLIAQTDQAVLRLASEPADGVATLMLANLAGLAEKIELFIFKMKNPRQEMQLWGAF